MTAKSRADSIGPALCMLLHGVRRQYALTLDAPHFAST